MGALGEETKLLDLPHTLSHTLSLSAGLPALLMCRAARESGRHAQGAAPGRLEAGDLVDKLVRCLGKEHSTISAPLLCQCTQHQFDAHRDTHHVATSTLLTVTIEHTHGVYTTTDAC